jgi:hypothetical protein
MSRFVRQSIGCWLCLVKLDKCSIICVGWVRKNYLTWVAGFGHLTLDKKLTCGLGKLDNIQIGPNIFYQTQILISSLPRLFWYFMAPVSLKQVLLIYRATHSTARECTSEVVDNTFLFIMMFIWCVNLFFFWKWCVNLQTTLLFFEAHIQLWCVTGTSSSSLEKRFSLVL